MKKIIIAVSTAIVTFAIGLFLGSLINSQPVPEKVQSVIPIDQTFPVHDCKKHKLKDEARSVLIAKFVRGWIYYQGEYNRLSVFETKNINSFAGGIQAFYRVGKDFAELRKTMEVNQLTPSEVGVTHGELRRIEALTYRKTLDAVYKLQKMGGTNRCIFEGGCFDTPEHLKNIKTHLTEKVLELE